PTVGDHPPTSPSATPPPTPTAAVVRAGDEIGGGAAPPPGCPAAVVSSVSSTTTSRTATAFASAAQPGPSFASLRVPPLAPPMRTVAAYPFDARSNVTATRRGGAGAAAPAGRTAARP